jgi:DNA repair photolyase
MSFLILRVVIDSFSSGEINCVINIDPILPLITNSRKDLSSIIDTANDIGVKYISGVILRIRYDIWERIKYILQILNIGNFIKNYEKIFKFKDPINSKRNLIAGKEYSENIMKYLRHEVDKRKMVFGFPLLNVKKIPLQKAKKIKIW